MAIENNEKNTHIFVSWWENSTHCFFLWSQKSRLFDSGSAWSRPVTAGVCGDILEEGAGVATEGTDETSPFCSSTLKGGCQMSRTFGAPKERC